MSISNRELSIKQTLVYEGGYCNVPSDPGGPTNWGITIYDARLYWKRGATAADVKAMPLDVAIEIYRQKYWAKMNCDADPPGVDFATFDYGVNSGAGRAIKVRATARKPSVVDWAKAVCDERMNFLHHLRTWSCFGKGWGRRVSDVKARAVKMALMYSGVPPVDTKKKLEDEADKAAKKAKNNGAAAGGTVAVPTSTQLPNVPHHVDVTTLDLSTKIGIAVACVAVVGVAFFFVWRWWHARADAQAYTRVAAEIGGTK